MRREETRKGGDEKKRNKEKRVCEREQTRIFWGRGRVGRERERKEKEERARGGEDLTAISPLR